MSHSPKRQSGKVIPELVPSVQAMAANANHPDRQWSHISWLVTAREGSKPQRSLRRFSSRWTQRDHPPVPAEEPGEGRGHQHKRSTSAAPLGMRPPGLACCWRSSHWKPPASRNRPPAAWAGPGPPCLDTPTFPSHEHSLPSPGNLLPPSQHPAPGTLASSRAPREEHTAGERSSSIPSLHPVAHKTASATARCLQSLQDRSREGAVSPRDKENWQERAP